MKEFKIRASACGLIMGKMGLSEAQEVTYQAYSKRARGEGKVLTAKQTETFKSLSTQRNNPKLPATATSYLKTWYSEQRYGKAADVQTKYTAKGLVCEDEAIEAIGEYFSEPMKKNEKFYESEWGQGTPDVVGSIIYDAKSPFSAETFLNHVTEPNDPLYEYQMRVYMSLTGLPQAKVVYVLLDTPAEINYGNEVIYSNTPIEERIYYFTVERSLAKEKEIEERVKLCRTWLNEYDKLICSKLD